MAAWRLGSKEALAQARIRLTGISIGGWWCRYGRIQAEVSSAWLELEWSANCGLLVRRPRLGVVGAGVSWWFQRGMIVRLWPAG